MGISRTEESPMSENAEKLKAALLELPIEERLELADFLYATLPPPPGAMCEGDPGFDEMLDQRLRDYESGKVKGVPADEFFRKLREKRQ
jgi:putative addiction module component (TIGR02574 family)